MPYQVFIIRRVNDDSRETLGSSSASTSPRRQVLFIEVLCITIEFLSACHVAEIYYST